jgi:hypothetical protein
MTTTAQPAKKTTAAVPAKKAAPAAPALDFASLKVEDSDRIPQRQGGRTAGENPMVPFIKQSWADRSYSHKNRDGDKVWDVFVGKAKQVTVPTAHKQAVTNLIRNAAERENLGVVIAYDSLPGNQVKVRFAAKTRKQKRPKPVTPTASA